MFVYRNCLSVAWAKDGGRSFRNKELSKISSHFMDRTPGNEIAWLQVAMLAEAEEPLLATVMRKRQLWFGHVGRHDTLSEATCRAAWREEEAEADRRSWMENIKDWSSQELPALLLKAQKTEVKEVFYCSVSHAPSRPPPPPSPPPWPTRPKDEMRWRWAVTKKKK